MKKRVGVLRFPGTNCDADVFDAFAMLGAEVSYCWWADRFDHKSFAALVLPGGFSYGDYLRAGAIAARTPAMDDVRAAAMAGVPVLGICNGFQVLTEAGLLPGALTKNLSRQFQEEWIKVRINSKTGVWSKLSRNTPAGLALPIAHSMGRYVASEETLSELFANDCVWLTYVENPNGALRDIAGITNKQGNVAALMPHPERALGMFMGSEDGIGILKSVL